MLGHFGVFLTFDGYEVPEEASSNWNLLEIEQKSPGQTARHDSTSCAK
jgi:hypothetical protein